MVRSGTLGVSHKVDMGWKKNHHFGSFLTHILDPHIFGPHILDPMFTFPGTPRVPECTIGALILPEYVESMTE